MFERYTEKARRVLFFSRYEASQYGSQYIEVGHLLLGLMREAFPTISQVQEVEKLVLLPTIEGLCVRSEPKTATGVDMPFSHASRRVLAYGAEESERLGHLHIGPEHLLLGVLREKGKEAEVLTGFGVGLDQTREAFQQRPRPSNAHTSHLQLLPGRYAVCRLAADAEIPPIGGTFFSITRTADELSVVCEESATPQDVKCELGWRALKVAGPLDFSLTGVLAAIAAPLAAANVSIFAISTFDTDYVLVKDDLLERALEALRQAGHRVDDR
jgi:hypothetical protein